MGKRMLWAFGLAALVLSTALAASGSIGKGGLLAGPSPEVVLMLAAPQVPGLDSHLAALAGATETKGRAAALDSADELGVDVTGTRLRVVVESADPAAARAAIEAAGGTVEAAAGEFTRAEVAPGRLVELARSTGIDYVRPPYEPVAEAVVDEAVASTNAAAWQAAGRTGAGVKVAVVDLGFAGYATAGLGTVTAVDCSTGSACVTSPGSTFTSTGHGTAAAAVVRAMAPGAGLTLISVADEIDLSLAEKYAKANAIKIVSHSVGWPNTSRGDGLGKAGTPDDTVLKAKNDGILWVNAAGDHARGHWSGNWAAAPSAANLLDFGSGHIGDRFQLAAGGSMCSYLKWDAGPGSAFKTSANFDLWLYDVTPGHFPILKASRTAQSGSQPPIEQLCFSNETGGAIDAELRVEFIPAPATPNAPPPPGQHFDLIATGDAGPLQHTTADGSVVEPASSPNALAVGAACWQTGALEPYSSHGLTLGGISKPDLVGPDSVSSPVYGAFGACGSSGFTGTSAAAPHVAGAAALYKQLNAAATPDQIRAFLAASAVGGALDLPATVTGFTPGSGPVGTAVVITGTALGATSSVEFGSAGAAPTAPAAATVKVNVPLGATSGQLRVKRGPATVTSAGVFHVTPRVDGFTPAQGVAGTDVTITGLSFTGTTRVQFGALDAAAFTVDGDREIHATVPAGAIPAAIKVTTGEGAGASGSPFGVILTPKITSIAPTSGPVGTTVTIKGTGLDTVDTAALGAVPAGAITHDSAAQIRVQVPAGAANGQFTVHNPAGTSLPSALFKVLPGITSVAPDHGIRTSEVVIQGTSLDTVTKVAFNGVADPAFAHDGPGAITAHVPGTATTGRIVLTNGSGTATSAVNYTVVLKPTISSFTPASAPLGATIAVNGTNLLFATEVTFPGGIQGAITQRAATQLKVTVPDGVALSGKLTVANDAGPSAPSSGLFRLLPGITGIDSDYGKPGDTVVIHGTSFQTPVPVNRVTFNGVAASFAVDADDRITATVPATGTPGRIAVSNSNGATTFGTPYTVILKPAIVSFTPASAPAGATITVTGSNLRYVTAVTFPNGAPSPVAAGATQTQLKTTVPAPYGGDVPAAGSGKLIVTNALAPSTASSGTFRVLPGITAVDRTQAARGATVTIDGTNIQAPVPVTRVTFNGVASKAVLVQHDGQVTATVPPTATTGKLAITTANGTTTWGPTFTIVPPPAISSFTPAAAPVGGTVTINGTGVGFATAVRINGGEAVVQSRPNGNQIKVAVAGDVKPAGKVEVVNEASPGGAATVSSGTFKAIPAVAGTDAPDGAAQGAAVVISGTAFGTLPAPTVKFNGVTAAVDTGASSGTAISTLVPVNATTGALTVTTLGGTTSVPFKVKPAIAQLDGLVPARGNTGQVVTIKGTTFVGVSSVKVNGVAAAFTVQSPTTIKATVPSTATTGKVTVTTPGGTATSEPDFVVDPAITSLSPASGATGSTVTIAGSGFHAPVSVTFGDLASPAVTLVGPNSIQAVVPDGADDGAVRVTTDEGVVEAAGGYDVTLGVFGLSVPSGPPGQTVSIYGTGFPDATAPVAAGEVRFGSVQASDVQHVSATEIRADVPPTAVSAPIFVRESIGGTPTTVRSVASFTVTAPVLTPVAAQRIVFRRTCCGLYVMNGDGTGITQLTADENDDHPAWSPDGTKIAFTRKNGSGDRFVYVMNANGSSPTLLGPGLRPTWSPAGTQIAFENDGAVWTMGSDGTGAARLTPGFDNEGSPKWSPDGLKIAFVRDPGVNQEVRTITLATAQISAPIVAKHDLLKPEWSPDGTQILYQLGYFGGARVWRVDATGAGDETVGPAGAGAPSWTRCSRIVVEGIAVLFPDGTGFTRLTNSDDKSPSCWEPAP